MSASLASVIEGTNIYAHSIAPFLDLPEILRLTAAGSTSRRWTQVEGELVVPCLGEGVPNYNPTWNFLSVIRRLHLPSLRAVKLEPKDLTSTVAFLAAVVRSGVPLEELELHGSAECLCQGSDELLRNFSTLFQGMARSKFMKKLSLYMCNLGPLFELGTHCERISWGSFSALDTLRLLNCSLTDKSVQSLARIFAARGAGPREWFMSCQHKDVSSIETAVALGDAVAVMERLRRFILLEASLEHTGYHLGQGIGLALKAGRLESICCSGISSESVVAFSLDMGLCANLKYVHIESDTLVAACAIIRGARSCRYLQYLWVGCPEEHLPADTACERLGSDVAALIACNRKLCGLSVPSQFWCSALFARHVLLAQANWDRPLSFGSVDFDSDDESETIDFNAGRLVGLFAHGPPQKNVATGTSPCSERSQ